MLSYAIVHVLNGIAFYILVATIAETPANPVELVGAYSLACAAGVVVPLVPGGLGVRELVLTALLSNQLSTDGALIAAGSMRAVSVVADLLPAAALITYRIVRPVHRDQTLETSGPELAQSH
jgi:uncharacterized membrane protein YbhN (UPF0104 family)